ncbi:MAG: DUF58 domain-containing protein [Abditibacteriaceae bacterium]
MITRRAYLVFAVGICFYLIALVNVLPSFYYALTWLMVGMLVSSMGLALMSLSGLQCQWQSRRHLAQEVIDDIAPEATAPSILFEFSNRGTLNKTGVIVEVWLRNDATKSTFKRFYLLEALASGSSIASEIPLLQLPRGEYMLQEIRLVGSDVLGLFRVSRGIFRHHENKPDAPAFVVGPALMDIKGNSNVPESALSWSGPGSAKWGQHSDEIRGIRAYAPGDDLRDVHWSSTARLGHLVVKEFTRPLEKRMLVVWDGSLDFNRQQESLEWSLRFCASLVGFALENNIPCSMLSLESVPTLLGDYQSCSVPLTLDSSQSLLARAQANRLTSLSEALHPYLLSAPNYGRLFLVTSARAVDTAAVLTAWRSAGGKANALQINVDAFIKQKIKSESSLHRQEIDIWPVDEDVSYASARKILLRTVLNYSR